ncbi:MAG: hypothetical protein ALECFALPRED_007347 [Alectoria fallacina]|uniref:Tafazzin n=1 Tax=Alectoria fallacina TaxID=1903189 RepID=A0A8H3G3U1_9LECA|nr:MAG: hypothetical protein ALECFALPRED_007347 [Alectoria fallacina]
MPNAFLQDLTRLKGPMPKRRAPKYDTKPNSPAHPSLSSSGKPKDARLLGSNATSSGNSVTDRIQRLRISQGVSPSLLGSQIGRNSSQVLSPGSGPSLPPSLSSILQLPDAPIPRPRPGLRVTGRARGPAGPAPPVSWLKRGEQVTGQMARDTSMLLGKITAKIERLPGSFLPTHGSLVHTTLKALAKNWDWHVQYDQHYLATIPIRYKEALLSYVARYSNRGTDKAGLEVLFLDDTELEDATGVDGLKHLDLSMSIGHPLKLKQLKDLLTAKKRVPSGGKSSDVIPESWDSPNLLASLSSLPRFHSLTHLSLSHPNNAATWRGLLDLAAPHLATLTHLSLAYWPNPTTSPNSITAYRETPQGNVNFGASSFYSRFDSDWSEAASILRRLSKSTYCLKWLDLTGCFPWVQALKYDQIDWCGAWRALETVKIGQGYIPECFQDNAAETAWREVYWNRMSLPNHEMSFFTHSYQKRQLVEWAHAEGTTMGVEETVNVKIGESMRIASASGLHEPERARPEGECLHGWPSISSNALSAGSRSQRVTFERGWDSWWIREAVRQIREMEATGDHTLIRTTGNMMGTT